MEILTAKIGNVLIGDGNPVVIQTMCNTHTGDVDESTAQCIRLTKAGAGLIRLTVQGMNEVDAIARIKENLRAAGYSTPLVADIHFRSDVALQAAKVVEKVRVNPGNFHKDFTRACEDFKHLIAVCKEYGTAIRIGVNHGSLGERITSLYGNSSEGMARAAMEWLQMCIDEHFFNVVVSLKASNVLVMIQSYRILQGLMKESGFVFPAHLGVTEAGNGDSARIKSAVGIATLLKEGIGDTVRVSLTEDPEAEIPAGYDIVAETGGKGYGNEEGHCSARVGTRTLEERENNGICWNRIIVREACKWGPLIVNGEISPEEMEVSTGLGAEKDAYLRDEILQACRKKFYRPEFVACPGCGRTMFSLEKVFNEVKERTEHLDRNICIAVMGCIVNGPGEMADADYGYVGEGRGLVTLYKGHSPVLRHIPEDKAIDKLIDLINSDR